MPVPLKLMTGGIFTPEDNILIGTPAYDNTDPIIHRLGIGDGGVQPRWFPGVDRSGNTYLEKNSLIKSRDTATLEDHGFGFEGTDFVLRIKGKVVFRVNTLGIEVKGLLKNDNDVSQFLPSDVGLAELIAPLFSNKTLIAQFNRPAYAGLTSDKKFVVTRSTSNFISTFGSSFNRGGTADSGYVMRINKYGSYEQVPQDEPRIQYDPRSKKCLGLLIEPSSTNLLIQSQNPTLWPINIELNITREIVNSWTTKGLDNPITFTEKNSNSEHSQAVDFAGNPTQPLSLSLYYQSRTFNGTRKFSFFVSDPTRSHTFGIDLQASSNSAPTVFANRVNGNGTVTKAYIEDLGNNIYRVKITGILNASATNAQTPLIATMASLNNSNSGSLIYTPGDMTPWCYMGSFQVEQRSYVTSYIKTATTVLTRNAETFRLNLQNNFNFTNIDGLLDVGMKINPDVPNGTVVFTLQNESGSDRIEFYTVGYNSGTKLHTLGTKIFVDNVPTDTNANFVTVSQVRGRINYSYENIAAAYTKMVFSGGTGIGATISSVSYE